jgi:YD repeat-containing protein
MQAEQAPVSQDNSAPAENNPSTCNPVVAATGEKLLAETDLVGHGLYGLTLNRTYRSVHAPDFFVRAPMFGPNWTSSLDFPNLVYSCVDLPGQPCVPGEVRFRLPDGSSWRYVLDASGPAPCNPICERARMERRVALLGRGVQPLGANVRTYYVAGGSAAAGELRFWPGDRWELQRERKVYVYNRNGYLLEIRDENGPVEFRVSYVSATDMRVQSVSNLRGQTVRFTWNGNRVETVQDAGNHIWRYAYNPQGMLASVTAPDNSVRSYHYEDSLHPQLLTGVSVNGVRETRYAYDPQRRVRVSGTENGEERDTFSYSATQTVMTSVTGLQSTYTFVAAPEGRRLVSVSRPAAGRCPAGAAEYSHDAQGYLVGTTDWRGTATRWTVDAAGRRLVERFAAGTPAERVVSNTWQDANLVRQDISDASGVVYRVVQYAYHPIGSGLKANRLANVTVTAPTTPQVPARSVSFDYAFHPNGALSLVTEARLLPTGNAVSYTAYDEGGRLMGRLNALGHLQQWTGHDGRGLPGSHTDVNGVVTRYAYSAVGTLVSAAIELPTGVRTTSFTHDARRRLTDVEFPDGSAQRWRYNSAGRLHRSGNAQGEWVTEDLDIAANRMTVGSVRHVPLAGSAGPVAQQAGSFSMTLQLDCLRRRWVQSGNAGQQVTELCDANGNTIQRTDALGHRTTWTYDEADRVTRIVAPGSAATELRYNADGQVTQVTDPLGLVTRYRYNGFGDLVERTSPDTGVTTFAYDSAGRLITETRADGAPIRYTWDALDRMTSRSRGTLTETFRYDEGSHGRGRLTGFNDAGGSTTLTYLPDGQLGQQTQVVAGQTLVTTWSFDALGRLSQLAYPGGGLTLRYLWHGNGLLQAVQQFQNGTWATLADGFLYQPATGLPYAWRWTGGLQRLVTLDTDGRVQRVASLGGALDLQLGYDTADRITLLTDALRTTHSSTFQYDAQDRLRMVLRSGDNQSFTLDDAHNRMVHSRAGGSWSYARVPGSHRLLSVQGTGLSRIFSWCRARV